MDYLLDTVALIRHFSRKGKIGNRAAKIIQEGEANKHQLYISIISLMEIMYLAENRQISISLTETLNQIDSKSCYTIIDLNTEIVKEADKINFYELHDRLILATSRFNKLPILSSDEKFDEVSGIRRIWEK